VLWNNGNYSPYGIFLFLLAISFLAIDHFHKYFYLTLRTLSKSFFSVSGELNALTFLEKTIGDLLLGRKTYPLNFFSTSL